MKNNLKNMSINEISYHIRGAVYDVYKALGPGLLESVYEEALCFELEERGLKVDRQVQVPIIYKGRALKTELRLDLLVEDLVIVELKSVVEMRDVYYKQTLTYCKLFKKRLGLQVNFNTEDILNSIYRVANGLDGHAENAENAEKVSQKARKTLKYFSQKAQKTQKD